MKFITTVVCLLIVSGSSLFGQVTQQWFSTYTQNATSDDYNSKMVIDASGNSYVTGWSYLPAGGNYVTVKYNSAGVEQWSAVFNGAANNDDNPADLGVDAAGNVYVTGSSFNGTYNYLTVKYNSSGIQQWTASYNGTGNGTDDAYAIAVDANGNSYVTGRTQGANGNFATIKYNTAGTQLWVAIYNGIGNNSDGANAIAIDAAGNSYVTGYSANGTNMNYATVMYNTAGIQQWASVFNGAASLEDRPTDIAIDGLGNTYVTGFSVNASNNKDYATVKYNSTGVQQWVSVFNQGTDEPAAIVADASGNTWVTGYSIASTWNYATLMYNSSGVQQWLRIYDTFFGDEIGQDVAIDASGNSYVTGSSSINVATIKYTLAGVQEWAVNYNAGTSNGNHSIAVDGSGNVYVGANKHNGMNDDLLTIKYAPIIPLSASSSQFNVTCNAACNGSASVVAANGTAPYTYAWLPSGGNAPTASSLCAGNYTCTITDNIGATITQSFAITQPTAVTASSNSTAILCNGGSTTITVSGSGGTAPYTGTGTFTGTAGTYSYTVTDANGCTNTTSITVTQPTVLTAAATATPILCNGGSATITVAGSGGTAPYTGTGTFTVTAGTYSYTVTDANGCTNTTSITLTQPIALTATSNATAILCNGGTTTVVVGVTGGTSPYTGTGTFTVTAGTYSYTVTDANGCTNTTSITVTEPTALTASSSATSILCNGGNATVTVVGSGGTSPYTGAGTFTVTAGTYSYTVTDANGCASTTSITVTQPSALTASSNATAILCNGGTTTVVVGVTGGTSPYTGTGTFTVTAGTYSYTVTDANGCSNTTSITVTEPTALTAAATATSISCNGGNATVTVVGAGGTAPYTGEGSFTVAAGTYSYTVTDANGCTTTTSITVTEPTAISTTAVTVNVSCNGDSTGSIDLTVTGGTGPYTFDWNSGTYTTEDLTGLGAGTYVGGLTDANGCTDGGTIIISEPAVLVATVTATVDPSTCGAFDGSIDITVSGGTIGYTYLWNTTATTEDVTLLSAGAYSCTVTDTNGCTATINAALNDPNAPTVTLALAVDTMCSIDGMIVLTGGTPAGGGYAGPGVAFGTFDPAFANIGLNVISYNYVDSAGCSGNALDSIYVDICTGTLVSGLISQVSIYPNPTDGFITVLTPDIQSEILVYDAFGKLVLVNKATTTKTEIDLSGMNNGVYFVQVRSGDDIEIRRLILSK